MARLLGEELYVDPELEAQVRGFFGNRGITMPENNIKQAMLIPSASAIPNPMGTAPGWWTQKDGKILVSMPGPPRELRHMWENQVRPRLRDMVGGGLLTSRTLKITGISEGGVDEMCGDLLKAANPSIGVYARPDGIHVRLAAKAMTEAEADALIGPVEAALRDRFGEHVWGVDDETMEEHVGKLLTERGLTLATMESLTGGMLGDTITNVPGSSRYYRGGIVAYQTELKIKYGVPRETIEQHGAVSEETAVEMARAARRELGRQRRHRRDRRRRAHRAGGPARGNGLHGRRLRREARHALWPVPRPPRRHQAPRRHQRPLLHPHAHPR